MASAAGEPTAAALGEAMPVAPPRARYVHNGTREEEEELEEGPLYVADVFVDGSSEESLREGAFKVLSHVRPHWDPPTIRFKTFTDGITNQLVACWPACCGRDDGGDLGADETVLLRVYGQRTELFIDRSAEVLNMRLLHAHGLAAPLHCAFRNGLCYGFNPGQVVDTALVRDPYVSRLIAQTLARMHSVRLRRKGGGPATPSLFPTLHKYLGLVPTHFDDLEKNHRFVSSIPSRGELEREVSLLEAHLSGLGSPVVFCHNDLLVKNIIYQPEQDRVVFIDYEYADNNYQALDIGNHFCEFGGVERFDSSLYPEREFQLRWLRHYLDEWHRLAGRREAASPRDVELLYVQVNKFALASCMLWCLWALIQAAHSTIKFDFLRFALERLDMYKRHKAEFMDLQLPPS